MGWSCKSRLKSEFNSRNLFMDHNNPATFVQFQFGGKTFYTLWRLLGILVSAGLVATSLQLTVTSDDVVQRWPIYLTNWSLLLLVFNALLDFSASLYTQIKRKDLLIGRPRVLPWYLKVVWVIHNVSQSSTYSVTLLYWTLVYNGGATVEGSKVVLYLGHGLNCIYVTSVILVSGIPTRLLHFYQTFVYSVAYIVFSITNRGAEKHETHAYYFLDWSVPSRAWPYAMLLVLVNVVCHCAVFFVVCLREFVTSKVVHARGENSCYVDNEVEYLEFSSDRRIITKGDENQQKTRLLVPMNLLDTIT
ncbi:protein rolling stone-like [Gigantopelta aegis]|uniref:protein rolling stone-like n=1 Tax=Gigantopelta aegis TaxID=1735272 RepID=UPI001B888176|nr:protein rolling stone-like [Gigantopelta aegis]